MSVPKLIRTSSNNIEILDVSNMLYVATSMTQKISFNPNIIGGVDVSGVSYIINKIASNYSQNVRTVLTLDSFTERRSHSSYYKANRVFHPEIAVQSEIIETYFKDFGVDVLRIGGMEADDIIYSVVYTNIDSAQSLTVYSGDSDLYGSIIDRKVVVVGTSSTRPTVNSINYANSCKPKKHIPYNTILAHNMIYGKASNNLPVLKTSVKNAIIWDKFVEWFACKESYEGSTQAVFIEFCLLCSEGQISDCIFTDSDLEAILERLELVYPFIKDIPIEKEAPEIDTQKLVDFLTFYRQYNACEKFGLNNFINRTPVGSQYNTQLKRWSAAISNGTLAADNHLASNTLPIPVTSTSEFLSVEEWE